MPLHEKVERERHRNGPGTEWKDREGREEREEMAIKENEQQTDKNENKQTRVKHTDPLYQSR